MCAANPTLKRWAIFRCPFGTAIRSSVSPHLLLVAHAHWIAHVSAEHRDGIKSERLVQRPRLRLAQTGLQLHYAISEPRRATLQFRKQTPADAASPRGSRDIHALYLHRLRVDRPQRAATDRPAVEP